MMDATREVLAEVGYERDAQDQQWGGPTHDSQHDPDVWIRLIREWCVKADSALNVDNDMQMLRRRMIQIAALAVASVETFDRDLLNNTMTRVVFDGNELTVGELKKVIRNLPNYIYVTCLSDDSQPSPSIVSLVKIAGPVLSMEA